MTPEPQPRIPSLTPAQAISSVVEIVSDFPACRIINQRGRLRVLDAQDDPAVPAVLYIDGALSRGIGKSPKFASPAVPAYRPGLPTRLPDAATASPWLLVAAYENCLATKRNTGLET